MRQKKEKQDVMVSSQMRVPSTKVYNWPKHRAANDHRIAAKSMACLRCDMLFQGV